jgi:hypothetical protein
MNRTVAFGLVGPVIVALLGAFVYVPAVIYLNGQSGVGADTYEVAFVLFLIMGLVPEWLNFIVVALGRTQLRSSIGAGLFCGAAMAFMPKLVGLPHENPIVCALDDRQFSMLVGLNQESGERIDGAGLRFGGAQSAG